MILITNNSQLATSVDCRRKVINRKFFDPFMGPSFRGLICSNMFVIFSIFVICVFGSFWGVGGYTLFPFIFLHPQK